MSIKEKNILVWLLYLLGFFSLFLLPSFGKFNSAHFLTIILGIFLGFLFLRYNFIKDFWQFFLKHQGFFLLALLYFIATVFGAIYHKNLIAIITSLVFLVIFFESSILAFLSDKFQENYFRFFWLGLYISSLFTCFLIFVDVLLFLFTGRVLLEFLPESLTFSAGTHGLKNLDNPLPRYFSFWPPLRASAFSWDPGLNGPALVLVFVLVFERLSYFPFRYLGLLFLFMAILVSFSKTSVVGFLGYILLKIFLKTLGGQLNFLKQKILQIAPTVIFLFLFSVGYFFTYKITDEGIWNTGVLRHLKYLGSVIYLANTSIWEILFGFGYRHTGYFLLNYVPWFKIDMGFDPMQDIESFLTNVFLWGGLVGALYWVYGYIKAYQKANEVIKLILLLVLLLTFGYNFHAVWFLFLYHSFLWYTKLSKSSS